MHGKFTEWSVQENLGQFGWMLVYGGAGVGWPHCTCAREMAAKWSKQTQTLPLEAFQYTTVLLMAFTLVEMATVVKF